MNKVFEKAEEAIWECRNCGHLVMGKKAPEACPVCAHPKSFFEIRKENYQSVSFSFIKFKADFKRFCNSLKSAFFVNRLIKILQYKISQGRKQNIWFNGF
jgi:rubredoxin